MYRTRSMESFQGLGIWSWFLQRISGLLIIPLLIIHLWSIHFGILGRDIIAPVLPGFRTSLFLSLDLILIVIFIYHSLNGIRVIAIDFGIGNRAQKTLFWSMMGIGVATFIFSIYAFSPLILGRPLF